LCGLPLPARVTIVEVGPRDGLQNEPGVIPTDTKVRFIELLADAGLAAIEATSFVSPKWVPQLADADAVLRRAKASRPAPRYAALTPNLRGFERAVAAGADEVAIFGAASEAFSRRNINCSIDESLARFREVAAAARAARVRVRGYVSCAVHCPYSGDVPPEAAARVARALLDMGCYEVSLGDTTGRGTPAQVAAAVRASVDAGVPVSRLAAHLHDTYGQALANALAALQQGVSVFDASAGGLGGCPYSPGASGNVATEDLVYMLSGLGVAHGVDLAALVDASAFISRALGREPASHVARAMAGQRAAAEASHQAHEGGQKQRKEEKEEAAAGGVEADERRRGAAAEGVRA
jgi:hydroxymethylglutaryl-CoA lyase